jgi:hypothetical protein
LQHFFLRDDIVDYQATGLMHSLEDILWNLTVAGFKISKVALRNILNTLPISLSSNCFTVLYRYALPVSLDAGFQQSFL